MTTNPLNNLHRDGRAKGQKNKFTKLKEDFFYAFKKMGGRKELAEWALLPRNRDTFYKLVIQLIPKEMKIDADINTGTRVLMLPAREFHDGIQVEAPSIKQPISTPKSGEQKANITPLLAHTSMKNK
ncbi:hypothetical protein LCGC14_1763900 [marine sediment metagenome]|uniref:Uncharacterized protein n=1 Tax=marine sediment metagenome TaxID=412755 RepID=A0A0F9HMQ1_9ZZZZ